MPIPKSPDLTTVAAVTKLLEANKNERGIAHWKKTEASRLMASYGIGLTKLKGLVKQIGKSHELAQVLWQEKVFDLKTLAILVEEPKLVTREQVEQQVEEIHFWMLSHVYCSMLLPQLPFARELAIAWADSDHTARRVCGFSLIGQLARDVKTTEDSFFEPYMARIEYSLQSEENFVRDAMNNALLMIGMRSKKLHAKALAIAKKIGPVEVDFGDNSCQATDVVKHLSSDRVKAKVAG